VKANSDRFLLILAGVLAVALILVVVPLLETPLVHAGDQAPDFTVTTDRGRSVKRSEFGGKLLVLNFWATWCAGCIEEMPSLDAFQREFASQGVVVLGISIDRNEKLYRSYLQRTRLSIETARDPEANISGEYGTFQYPETYLIDRSGKVVEKVIAAQNWMDPNFLARVRRML
jgi:cytochrome c biogenesis protein CcmG/thiol:disulfide interchange protein DsbE